MARTEGVYVEGSSVTEVPDGGLVRVEIFSEGQNHATDTPLYTWPVSVSNGRFLIDIPPETSIDYPDRAQMSIVATTPYGEKVRKLIQASNGSTLLQRVFGASTSVTLIDFNTTADGSTHIFRVFDPAPKAGRRYDLYINGVDQGVSKVYPQVTFTITDLPTDGSTLNVTLYWWDDDDFSGHSLVNGPVTAYDATPVPAYVLSEVQYEINTDDPAEITITPHFEVIDTATGLPVPSFGKSEWSLLSGNFEYNHWNTAQAYPEHAQVVPQDNPTYTTNRGPDLEDGITYKFRITATVESDSTVLVSPVAEVPVPALTAVRIANQRIDFDAENLNQISALNVFDVHDREGNLVSANCWTDWGPKGVRPLPYRHTSPGLYSENSQILPARPVNSGTNGDYIQKGQECDYQTFVRDPVTNEVVSTTIQTFTAPGDGAAVPVDPGTGSQVYDNLESPPVLNTAKLKRFLTVADLQSSSWVSDGYNCGGANTVWRISVPIDYDIFIDLDGMILTKPIMVYGGRHCIIKNMQIRLDPVGGCGIGEKRNGQLGPSNVVTEHPRIPGNRCVGVWNFGTTFVDGGWFRMQGHEGDIFVTNSGVYGSTKQSDQDAVDGREFVFVNLRAEGYEGTRGQDTTSGSQSRTDDGIHGDLAHNQDKSHKSMRFENVVNLASYNGITQQKRGSKNNQHLSLRNFTHDLDPVYGNDQRMDGDGDTRPDGMGGPAFTTRAEKVDVLGQCYFRNPRSDFLAFGIHNGNDNDYPVKTYWWDPDDHASGTGHIAMSNITRIPGDSSNFNDGNHDMPAAANFVPEAWAADYRSPWQSEYISRGYYG